LSDIVVSFRDTERGGLMVILWIMYYAL